MIALLKGRIEDVGDDWAIIDVNGVGYLVFCSTRALNQMVLGEAATIHVETHVREDHIHLYGFLDTGEREWFKLLTTVQGVGAKVGLALLSVLSNDELTHAIASGDKAQVGRANGVGPKLAARIVSELKDKVAKIALGSGSGAEPKAGATDSPALGGVTSPATQDAVSALVNLGYAPSDALTAISHAASKLGGDADVGALIKGGLIELGPKEHGS